MELEIVGQRMVLKRSAEEKLPLKQRLNKVEGQVRGLKQMIEDNRDCSDAIQQSSAAIAALREVTLIMISQQLQGQADRIAAHRDANTGGQTGAMSDFVDLLRSSYRFA